MFCVAGNFKWYIFEYKYKNGEKGYIWDSSKEGVNAKQDLSRRGELISFKRYFLSEEFSNES